MFPPTCRGNPCRGEASLRPAESCAAQRRVPVLFAFHHRRFTLVSPVFGPAPAAPEQRWIKCPSDGALIYHKHLQNNLKVCPECRHHFRLGSRERLDSLVDPGSFQEMSGAIEPGDPLGFIDSKPYGERLREA